MHVKHPLVKPDSIKLRSYQEAIVARAIEKNTLVVLPTGLGKTIIAAMVAAHRLHEFPDSKILFLAPTRPLAIQHERTFEGILNSDSRVTLTGMDAIGKRQSLWNSKQLIFATPQTIENDIYRGLNLKDVSLIIFDESHRAVGNYSYVAIAEEYIKRAKNPLVLGLTASPSSDKETVEAIRKNLFIERVEAKTEHDADVKPHIQKTRIEWLKVELPGEFKRVKKMIEDILRDDIRELKRMDYLNSANLSSINKKKLLKIQAGIRKEVSQGMDSYVPASLVASAIKINHALELLETQGISVLDSYLGRLQKQRSKAIKRLFMDPRMKELVKVVHDLRVMGIDHPKLDELARVVKEHEDEKIIVFTQYRDSVDKIIERLNENDVLAHEFIGQASRGNKKGMTQKEQVRVLENFKDGKYTALVATSIHPDEYIIVKDPYKRIRVERICDFVESFLDNSKNSKIEDWYALSSNGEKIDFYPILAVHKHPRQSEVVKIKLHSGAESLVTEDHSVFTFDNDGNHVPTKPEKNLFVNLAYSAPNIEDSRKIDVVKELIDHAPKKIINRVFCSFDGLNQPMMRVLSTNLKVLKAINSRKLYKTEIAEKSNLDVKTIIDATKRLEECGYIETSPSSRYCFCQITDLGKEYLAFLKWFFKKQYYWKRKYRVSLTDVISAPKNIDKFCRLYVEVLYGKTKVPRYLEMNDKLAEFLGFYVSEGSARKTNKTSDLLLSARNKIMQKRMKKSIREGLLFEPYVDDRGVYIHSQLAFLLVRYVFGCGVGAYNKEVPSIIFSSPSRQKWKFLEAYFLGDGYHRENTIVLTTVSRKLVVGLSLLLRQLGVRKITIRRDHAYRLSIYESLPFAKIKNKKRSTKKYYDLVPTALISERAFMKFGNRYGLSKSRPKVRTAKDIEGKTCFDFIKEIKKLDKQPDFVYDISVKGTERFFGGPGLICLHNSVAEEGIDIPKVDMVMFYEPVPSEIRTIQRRGRTGRSRAGKVVVLMAKGTRDEAYYWASLHKERKMSRIVREMRDETDKDVGQQSLIRYQFKQGDDPEGKIKIYVDVRERNTEILRVLKDKAKVELRQLPVGDFILSDRVGCERKTQKDFVQSIIDKRLLAQAMELSRNFEIPIFIVEGNSDLYSLRDVHPNAIRGSLAALAVNFGISVIPSRDEEDTAHFLYTVAKREQEWERREIALRGEKKPLLLEERQRYIIESLPHVSAILARRLLQKFGSVKEVINASEKEMMKVEAIGEGKAKEIGKVIRSRYVGRNS